MSEASLEKCLDTVPNRFELAILVMNRAKEILYGAKSKIETSKYTKKSVKKAMKEIEEKDIDLDELEAKIKKNLLVNNLFLKDSKIVDESIEIEDMDAKSEDDDFGDEFDDLDEDIEDEGDDLGDDSYDDDDK